MSLLAALKAHPTAKLFLDEGEFTYADLAEKVEALGNLSAPVIFTPTWSMASLAKVIAAEHQQVSLMLVPEGVTSVAKLPVQFANGHLCLRTSGSEGPPKWVIHKWSSIYPGLPLNSSVKHLSAALLAPHAAGIEVLTGVLLAGIDFSVGQKWKTSSNFADAVAGPPQQLGLWLAMASQHQERLTKMQTYFCCADAFQPHWESKRQQVAKHLKIEQVYGCSEAWQAPTETHAQFPWLIRFTNITWTVKDAKVQTNSARLAEQWLMPDGTVKAITKPYMPGDMAIEERAGWWKLKSSRHEVANFWGQKINLLEIEALALGLAGVADATAVIQSDPLAGETVRLQIVLTEDDAEANVRAKLAEQQWPFPREALVPEFGGTVASGKKMRIRRS